VTELRVIEDDENHDRVYVFRYVSTLSKEMTECMESYLKGMFSAYSLEASNSKVGLNNRIKIASRLNSKILSIRGNRRTYFTLDS
jgi:hypothetical protein